METSQKGFSKIVAGIIASGVASFTVNYLSLHGGAGAAVNNTAGSNGSYGSGGGGGRGAGAGGTGGNGAIIVLW